MRERVNLKSPVQEYCPPGSVRGARGNPRPYLDLLWIRPETISPGSLLWNQRFTNSQCSPKKPAAVMPPGARDDTGTLKSMIA